MSGLRIAESIGIQLPLRLGLGGLFCLAAFKKLQDPQSFAEAIKGFRVVDHAELGNLIVSAAFVLPWVEMIAGILLILGLWTRAAAVVVGLALAAFIAGLLSVIIRKLDASCSCFGDLNLFCGSKVGWCQVIRNLIMLLPTAYLIWRGGGLVALDAVLERSGPRGPGGSVDAIGDRA